jgi:hypothetical protein
MAEFRAHTVYLKLCMVAWMSTAVREQMMADQKMQFG